MAVDYGSMSNTLLTSMLGNNQNTNNAAKRSVITVAGLNEARGFNLNPGESIVLIDANDDYFYIKECDEIGKSTTKCFMYEEVELEDVSGSVSKKEFDKLSGDVKDLKDMVKELANGKHNSEIVA